MFCVVTTGSPTFACMPYMITGILNEHPRAAIARRDSEDRDKYAEFYEEILDALES